MNYFGLSHANGVKTLRNSKIIPIFGQRPQNFWFFFSNWLDMMIFTLGCLKGNFFQSSAKKEVSIIEI